MIPGGPFSVRDEALARNQRIAEQALPFIRGEANVDPAQLPWTDKCFVEQVRRSLAARNTELEKHRARFKALREVFGPESK